MLSASQDFERSFQRWLSRIDSTTEWAIIALLAFTPLAFGAVEAWSQMLVVIGCGAIAFLLIARQLLPGQPRARFGMAFVPLTLFLLIVTIQLIPLSSQLVQWISPHTVSAKLTLLGDLPEAPSDLHRLTLSFYTWATRHDLRMLLCIGVVFTAVIQVVRRPSQMTRLLASIAIIGAAVALLAIAQDMSGATRIYWTVTTPIGKAVAGPFVHYSHFSQFMELTIGAAIGLLMVRLHEIFPRRGPTLPAIVAARAEPCMRVVWGLTAFIVIGAIALFFSFSRGGMIALLSAAAFTTIILTARRGADGRGWFLTLLLFVVFAAVLYTGFDAVYQRLATLGHFEHAQEGRVGILRDLTSVYRQYPLLGTGMGTHEMIYPAYDHSVITSVATHAENEYAQLLEETGFVGFAIFVFFALLIWRAYFKCLRHRSPAICSAAYGLGFGLFAVMVHSLSDFGQHLPANAILSAVLCGLLLNLADLSAPQTRRAELEKFASPVGQSRYGLLFNRLTWGGGALVALLVWGWCLVGIDNAREAELWWQQVQDLNVAIKAEPQEIGTDDEFRDILVSAEAANRFDPGNANYHYLLNVYRWNAISRNRDPHTGKVLLDQQGIDFTRQVIAELNAGRWLCPTYGPPYCVAGQLEKFILHQPLGDKHIQTGFALAPTDSTACYVAGTLDASHAEWSAAETKFRHAIDLDSGLFRKIAECCIQENDHPQIAVRLAQGDIGALQATGDLLRRTGSHPELVAQVDGDAAQILRAQCDGPDASASQLASLGALCTQQHDLPAAVAYYQRAVELDYGQVDWRFQLAQLLKSSGKPRPAIHEARVCLQLRPQWAPAEQLVAELSVMPGMDNE